MGLYSWVPPAIPGPCKVSSSPMGCRGSSQERATVHPQLAQPQQQRRAPTRCWGGIPPPHCWAIQEGSCCFMEDMHKYSFLKAFARLKYTPAQSRPEPRAERKIFWDTSSSSSAIIKSLWWRQEVEGSYTPLAFCPRHWLLLSQTCLWTLRFLSLSSDFLIVQNASSSSSGGPGEDVECRASLARSLTCVSDQRKFGMRRAKDAMLTSAKPSRTAG